MSDGIIDMAALRRLLEVMGGDPEDLADLLEDYRETAPDLVSQLRVAAAEGDAEALRIAAHTLKSNARDFGARSLSEFCADLEAACLEGATPPDSAQRAERIAEAEAEARAALELVDPRNVAGEGS